MMPLDPQQDSHLVDSQGRCLGTVSIERIEGDRVFAAFVSGKDFAAVDSLFGEFEEAVNDQLFHEADRLSLAIDALGLRLTSVDGKDSLELRDVQIMNATNLSCRVPNLFLVQASRAAAHAG